MGGAGSESLERIKHQKSNGPEKTGKRKKGKGKKEKKKGGSRAGMLYHRHTYALGWLSPSRPSIAQDECGTISFT